MLTTIEEEVLELCTSTVTNTPITKPATGLDNTTLSWKMSPAALPVRTHIHTRQFWWNTWLEVCYIRIWLVGTVCRWSTVSKTSTVHLTSNKLESRTQNIQRTDEEIEESEQQNQLHDGRENPQYLPLRVQVCGKKIQPLSNPLSSNRWPCILKTTRFTLHHQWWPLLLIDHQLCMWNTW